MVLKVHRFQKCVFLLTVHADVSIGAVVALGKQKQTKWCLEPKIVLIKVLHQKNVTTIDE